MWRLSYITAIWEKPKEIKRDESLMDVIATILTEYLDSGTVTMQKYHQQYHEAIENQ